MAEKVSNFSKVRNHMMIYKETKESQLETLWNEEIRRCGW